MRRFAHGLVLLTLALLAALLCAADKPAKNKSNRPDLSDARKLRYSYLMQAADNKGAGVIQADQGGSPGKSDTSQLSLLPADASPATTAPPPSSSDLQKEANLSGGVTAARSLVSTPRSGSGAAAVRSMAIDGAPFGEERLVRNSSDASGGIANEPPPIVAQGPPRAEGGFIADAPEKPAKQVAASNAKAPTSAKPSAAKEVARGNGDVTKPKLIARAIAVPKTDVQLAHPLPDKRLARTSGLPTNLNTKLIAKASPTAKKNRLAQAGGSPAQSSGFVDSLLADASNSSNIPVEKLRRPQAASVATVPTPPLSTDASQDPVGLAALDIPRLETRRFPLAMLLGAGGAIVAVLLLLVLVLPRPRTKRAPELALLETIGLGDGREICIVKKKHYALVLGVTRTATHLLEKVSSASLDSDYRSVVSRIIARESDAPVEQWRLRPLFATAYQTTYAPDEPRKLRARSTSLHELRAGLTVIGPPRAARALNDSLRGSQPEARRSVESPQRAAALDRESVVRRLQEQARAS